MKPASPASPRRPVGGQHGQAAVEFAMTIGVFLLMLFGALEAAVYTLERSAAVTAVAAGARVAAGGGAGAGILDVTRPDLAGAGQTVAGIAGPRLFGTRVSRLPTGRPCPALTAIPRAEVRVCTTQAGDMITVGLRGRPASLVPTGLGPGWTLDVAAELHSVTFTP